MMPESSPQLTQAQACQDKELKEIIKQAKAKNPKDDLRPLMGLFHVLPWSTNTPLMASLAACFSKCSSGGPFVENGKEHLLSQVLPVREFCTGMSMYSPVTSVVYLAHCREP